MHINTSYVINVFQNISYLIDKHINISCTINIFRNTSYTIDMLINTLYFIVTNKVYF